MNPEQKTLILEATQTIVQSMNVDCRVELKEDVQDGKQAVTVSIYTPDNAKFLIGRNGQNLQALEHIVRAICSKGASPGHTILIDVNDYRKLRATRVLEVAKQAVLRVRNSRRAEALMPMSAYERRVVHTELASLPDVATESIGQEPQRRIIIKPLNI
ncbi:MAG: hypothetical protein A3C88_00635 [Candidatus Yanofskybacteria bacterium RIFCSPHIGHO2_02_FULL_50_12]|uniref:R3H domain-containing protein n=1 Tax=Candidatus Yanofskybacteria bacterium RIFCSPHIGHO2_02_FULL_50_12 TaxID=1802685 RepID=A0A1F8FVC1_9BACT|nr:MAG: hypothetical protein A3C88_00635 [Candidatus Yanofskybacteria bacterium RIFCSPHIGHO2_02_FULL_50_12]